MKNKSSLYIFIFFFFTTLLFFGYFKVFQSLIGHFDYNAYSYDTYNIDLKLNRARSLEGKKIIINSGSNSNFGINTKIIEDSTGYRSVNLANHASSNIKYINYLTLKYLKPGDIVIYPLEYVFYGRNDIYNDYQIRTYLNNGNEYYNSLDWIERLNFITHVSPQFFLQRQLRGKKREPKDIVTLSSEVTGQFLNYQHRSLSLYLDMNVGIGTTPEVHTSASRDKVFIPKISADFKREIIKVSNMIKERGAKFYITFPSILDTVGPSIQSQEQLKRDLQSHGIRFICEPGSFDYPIDLFFNTFYHLNKRGADVRTVDLVECLKDEKVINDLIQ